MHRLLSPIINPQPDPSVIPGAGSIDHVINGLAWLALAGCVASVLLGAAAWAASQHSGNFSWAARGKRGVLSGVLGAVIVGGAYALVTTAFTVGSAITPGN